MYDLSGYGKMIADRVRMDAYAAALRDAIRPGATVLDIGTGTGIMALLACRFGAGKVYAVEPSQWIEVARAAARDNGFADRIEFLQDLSTRIAPPRKADVVVSDVRGVLPLLGHHIPTIVDARARWLAPGGELIPQVDRLWAAVAEVPEAFEESRGPWNRRPYDFELGAAAAYTPHCWCKGQFKAEQLLSDPVAWAELDYRSVTSPDLRGTAELGVRRAGIGHGLAVWFSTVLRGTAGFDNAPDKPEMIYRQAYFPWRSAVPLEPGDLAQVAFRADLVRDDYVWGWKTRVTGGGRAKASFDQSTFFGQPVTKETLRKRSADFVPSLNEAARIDALALAQMREKVPLASIGTRLCREFPERFKTAGEALAYLGILTERYSD